VVEHNQNDNLRPPDKLVRSVCLNCHGLGFSFDALSDPSLTRKNFQTKPAHGGRTLELVRRRKAP
jgi:mono/diheme cytochrome c family protein